MLTIKIYSGELDANTGKTFCVQGDAEIPQTSHDHDEALKEKIAY
jgi:hypothetical protein